MKPSVFAGILIAAFLLLLAGCESAAPVKDGAQTDGLAGKTDAEILLEDTEMFSGRDYEVGYDEDRSAVITLEGSTAKCDSDAVKISGSTITVLDEGTYIFSGVLDDGMIVVDAESADTLQLVFSGVTVNSGASAALYIKQAETVVVTLAPDSVNTLSNGGAFTPDGDTNIDAVIFSKDDLTLNGQGSLRIESPSGHGVVSKDNLAVTGGTYTVTAAGHGLCGKDSVRIAGGSFDITAGKDGIHAENAEDTALGFAYIAGGTYQVTASGDGISASGNLLIEDGTFTIFAGGGSANVTQSPEGGWSLARPGAATADAGGDTVSAKGVKAAGTLQINGGSFVVDSADDAFHTDADLTVNGGSFEIETGDDAFHADAAVKISGGKIVISKSYEGIEGQNIFISGGEISITSSDDGLNAAGGNDQSGFGGFGGFDGNRGEGASSGSSIEISGGTLNINASGDGVDSNGSLTVSGGTTYVSGSANSGNGALDYSGTAVITGGVFIAAGASGMAQNFGASSTQGAMLVSVGARSGGDTVIVTDSAGNELLKWTAPKAFDCVVLSCPEIRAGETYTVSAGGVTQEVVMSSLIYGSGGMGAHPGGIGGQFGGMGGGRGDMGGGKRP